MHSLSQTAIATLLTLSACGGDAAVLQSPDGSYRVVQMSDCGFDAQTARREVERAVQSLTAIDLVFAHDDAMALAAAETLRDAGRLQVPVIGVGALPDAGRKLVADGLLAVSIENPSGAEAALDLALLACSGVPVPRAITVGARVFTNTPRSPQRIPSPGDVLLTMLRAQHAVELAASKPIRIGVAQHNETEPRRKAMRQEMDTWVKAHASVQLQYQSADGDQQRQSELVGNFVAQKLDAILVVPAAAGTLVDACRLAQKASIPVIVLDGELGSEDYNCFVSSDNLAIGRAAGTEAARLLPAGGAIVVLQGLMTTSAARDRHTGFVESLQLLAPR